MYKYRPANSSVTYTLGIEITSPVTRDIYAVRADRPTAEFLGAVIKQRGKYVPVDIGYEYKTMRAAAIALLKRREANAQTD